MTNISKWYLSENQDEIERSIFLYMYSYRRRAKASSDPVYIYIYIIICFHKVILLCRKKAGDIAQGGRRVSCAQLVLGTGKDVLFIHHCVFIIFISSNPPCNYFLSRMY